LKGYSDVVDGKHRTAKHATTSISKLKSKWRQ